MKLVDSLKCITKISDSHEQNLQNYLRSINYISNLYKFQLCMTELLPETEYEYLPSFKDIYISEELGLTTITEENELRLIIIKSSQFLVDGTVKQITAHMKFLCNKIESEKDIMTFYLK